MRVEDIGPAALEVCQRLAQSGHGAQIVGGCVRDLLLGRRAKDWDVATSAHPDDVQRLFKKTIPTGIAHGTVTVLIRGEPVEVTTYRGEGAYSDARRPDHVVFGVTLEEDLARRDFTMNAIAFDPVTQELHDPFGGKTDLDAQLIRAVGDPEARFREDGLRVMRAIRFAAILGFALDPATEAAIPSALGSLTKVSAERVRDELLKLLGAERPSLGLLIAERTGILATILPELAEGIGVVQNHHHRYDVWRHTVAAVDGTPGDAIVRLGTLLHDVAKPRTAAPKADAPGEFTFYRHDTVGAEMTDAIARRLKLSNKERERIVALVGHHMFWYSPEWSDATVRRFIRRVGADLLPDLFALRTGDVVGRGYDEDPDKEIGELKRRVDKVVSEDQALSINDLAIDGQDVMRVLGIPASRQVGDILRQLLEEVIEDPEQNDRERLIERLGALASAKRA